MIKVFRGNSNVIGINMNTLTANEIGLELLELISISCCYNPNETFFDEFGPTFLIKCNTKKDANLLEKDLKIYFYEK